MILAHWRAFTVLTVLVLGCSAGGSRALALTQEEAKAQCRESVGRPIVTSCMFSRGVGAGLGKKTSSEIEEARKACMPKAYAPVVACVEKMMNAAHGRANVPVALTEEKPIEATLPDQGAVVFVAPPRTIKDITAILDEEKPDPVKLAKLQGKADAQPPGGVTKRDLAWFYFLRAHGRDQLGRLKDAIADIEKGLEVAQVGVEPLLAGRLRQLAIRLYLTAGSPKKALSVNLAQIQIHNQPGSGNGMGYLFDAYLEMTKSYILTSDLAQAETYLRRNEALIITGRTSGIPLWREGYEHFGHAWESDVHTNRAILLEARGRYRDAEAQYRLAERHRRASVKGVLSFRVPGTEEGTNAISDALLLAQARVKAKQGRLVEAEADARRALVARLKEIGKYNPSTPKYILGLADGRAGQVRGG